LNSEARLSLVGRIVTRQYLLELLENRLRLVAHWKLHPEIEHCQIRQPLFITGVPRSGTTLLHHLLAQDPANRAPTHWEVMFPWPLGETLHTDFRIAQAETRLRWTRLMAPKLISVHPMGARLPQECIAIMAYSLFSTQFDDMYRVPSYETWLKAQDMRPAYHFHRAFLGHLQWRAPVKRWVLKAPSHLLALDAILATYPDACIIQTHRDPAKVLGSVASLGKILQGMFSNQVDPIEIGAKVCRNLRAEVEQAMAFRDKNEHLRKHFLDVHYLEFIRNPIETIRHIYEHFGLSLCAKAENKMQASLAVNRSARRKVHAYRLTDFGLDWREVELRFAAYRERFAIQAEPL
jgi:hypothetical protein